MVLWRVKHVASREACSVYSSVLYESGACGFGLGSGQKWVQLIDDVQVFKCIWRGSCSVP